jgi:hypothetical protein
VQAFCICSSEIIKGGEIRKQFDANKNQSVKTPLAIHLSIIFLFVSKESNSTAIHSPKDLIAFIFGLRPASDG